MVNKTGILRCQDTVVKKGRWPWSLVESRRLGHVSLARSQTPEDRLP